MGNVTTSSMFASGLHKGASFHTTLLVLVFAPILLAADTLVKPETATPIEICPSCEVVRVPLVPDDKSKIKTEEAPEVEFVYLGGSTPKDARKFSAKWIDEPFPRAIEIVLDHNEVKQAGMYDLYLNLQPHTNPSAGRLKIQLTRPAATIETIPKLILNRTYWFIGCKSDTHPNLLVTETSKKTGITISGVRPISNSSIGTTPLGGTLEFPLPQPEIEAGHQEKLSYQLKNDFDLGTATGTMKIDSLQLANPASFDFEVHSRVHWIYIGITIAVGLFISYLVKVRLQQKIEFDQAHVDAQKLVERIAQEAGRHADPLFAEAYRNELAAVAAAMNSDSAADINTAKLELDTAWHVALQNLARRHQDQLDALEKLRDVTNYDWLVPREVFQAVVTARDAQTDVVRLIDRDDLTEANKRRQQIILKLGDDIRTAALNWQKAELQILTLLQAGPAGISAANTSALGKPVTDLLADLHKVDENTALARPEQIQQTLSDLKFERISVQQFFQWLSNAIQMERAEAEAQISNPPPAAWNAPTFAGVKAEVNDFTTFLRTLADDPVVELPTQLNAVHQAWTNALQNQFAAPNASVQTQLDARNYVQATRVAFQQKTTPPGAAAALAPVAGPAFLPPEFQRDTAGAAALPVYAIHTLFQTIVTPTPAFPTSVTDAAKLRREKRTQSLIIGLLLVVAGYGLQLSTFVGTFTDFSTLFFWAFALDLTIDQLGKMAKKA